MRDLHNNIEPRVGLNTVTITSDTTTAGNIIDLQGYEAIEWVITSGTLTDGDYTPLIEEGDESNLSDASAVADVDLLGTEAEAAFTTDTDDNKNAKIGYIGGKRYVRLSLVSTNTATNGATFTATAILGKPHTAATPANSQ